MKYEEYLIHLTDFADDELHYMIGGRQTEHESLCLRKSNMRIVRCIGEVDYDYHSQDAYSLCYLYNGIYYIHTDDGTPVSLKQGDLCIVPPGTVHRFLLSDGINTIIPEKNRENIIIRILFPSQEALRIFAPLLSSDNPISTYISTTLYGKDYKKFMILRSPSEANRSVAERAFYEVDCLKDTGGDEITADLFLNILLLDYVKSGTCVCEYAETSVKNCNIALRVIDYIDRNFLKAKLEDICEKFHYSASYIERLIRTNVGSTFKNYIIQKRLEFICDQLIHTNKNIKTILKESGYASETYFFRIFRNKYGMSPCQYRETYKQV